VSLTVGIDVGGGPVLGGEVDRGGFGVAAEFGHMRVVPGGRLLRVAFSVAVRPAPRAPR